MAFQGPCPIPHGLRNRTIAACVPRGSMSSQLWSTPWPNTDISWGRKTDTIFRVGHGNSSNGAQKMPKIQQKGLKILKVPKELRRMGSKQHRWDFNLNHQEAGFWRTSWWLVGGSTHLRNLYLTGSPRQVHVVVSDPKTRICGKHCLKKFVQNLSDRLVRLLHPPTVINYHYNRHHRIYSSLTSRYNSQFIFSRHSYHPTSCPVAWSYCSCCAWAPWALWAHGHILGIKNPMTSHDIPWLMVDIIRCHV